MFGGDPAVISFAAERLGVPAGMLRVRSKRLSNGAKFITVRYGNKCGWSGVAKAATTDTGV